MIPSDFLLELKQLVARRSVASQLVDTLAFVSEVAERLEMDPVFGEFELIEYQGYGSKNRPLKLHGFTRIDESDGSIGLVIGKWEDIIEPETLGTAMVAQLSNWLENFVRESINNALYERIAEVNPAYELSLLLYNEQQKINRIRLHIITNLTLSSRFKEELPGEINNLPLERHIWDLDRLSAIYQSGREREAVSIDVTEYGENGIPCLEAVGSDDLCSYLCVIKGDRLADLFERYGSRLLEGNVRSFLGMKVGVNKGIRRTIQVEPELFFAYNNGIAATASEVTVESCNGNLMITRLVDLQIVNGGQTTASLLSARKKDKLSLKDVSVQMKLTMVSSARAADLVPSIAEYANTQNKVATADFFANHPFHRKMEEISRRLLTRAVAGVHIQSKWFYERSRGQYQNARLYLSATEKSAHEKEYPPSQVLNKTDLAKYAHSMEEKPHWVSLGAQKNFAKFATKFSTEGRNITEAEHWDSISSKYGEEYFKALVAGAILWKKAENTVDAGRGVWYEGGYRANLVTYMIAKLMHDVRKIHAELDLERIWSNQAPGTEIEHRFEQLAPLIQAKIFDTPVGVKNVSEWCKKEDCWAGVAALDIPWVISDERILISKEEHKARKTDEKKKGTIDDEICLQTSLFELVSSGYWDALYSWAKTTNSFSLAERSLIQKASTPASFMRINQPRDWKKLMLLKRAAEDEGFLHED